MVVENLVICKSLKEYELFKNLYSFKCKIFLLNAINLKNTTDNEDVALISLFDLRNFLLDNRINNLFLLDVPESVIHIMDAVNLINTNVCIYLKSNINSYYINGYNRSNFLFVFDSKQEKEKIEKKYKVKFTNSYIFNSNNTSFESQLKKLSNESFVIPKLSKKPLLSISIASYNVEKFIIQILCSLLRSKYSDKLEILVVNDGSKDKTVEFVNNFIKKFYNEDGSSIIKFIDKENGGHGSTVNKGIESATGKYFKLLDGDDYYITSELDKLIETLENEDSDMILTEYIEDFSMTGDYIISNMYDNLEAGKKYDLNDNISFKDWGPILHTSTYKTKLLQDANFKLDEHCFYVDMEYNFIGFAVSNTMKYYPLHIYSYYLGRNGQSISPESYKKNVLHHEKVTLRLLNEFYKNDKISDSKKEYFSNKLLFHLVNSQYDIVTKYFSNNKYFKSFDSKLKKYPEFYNNKRLAGKIIKFHRLTHGKLLFMNNLLIKLFRNN